MKKFVLPVLFLMLVCSSHAQHQRATIGIYSTTVSKSKAKTLGFENPYGSYVRKIYPNSGAAAAGLQAFDYVTGVNDEEVARHYTISDILSQYQPGDEVKVSLVRQNKPMEMMVRLGDRSNLKFARRTAEEDPFFGISPKHKRLPPGVDGVPVTIINNSTAQAMGLEDGDIVLTVDGNPVLDWHDIDPAVDNRQVGDPITVKFFRNGIVNTRTRPIKSSAATHNDHSRPNGPVIVEPEADEILEALPITPAQVILENIERADMPFLPIPPASFAEAVEEEEIGEEENPRAVRLESLQYDVLRVFPNPNTGIFDLEFKLPERGRTFVRVFSPSGQVVYQNSLGVFSGMFSDRIDIANSVRGIYFLEVRQDERSITRKIVLQ